MEKEMVESWQDVFRRLDRVLSTCEKKCLSAFFLEEDDEECGVCDQEVFCSPETILTAELDRAQHYIRDRLVEYINQVDCFAELIRGGEIKLHSLRRSLEITAEETVVSGSSDDVPVPPRDT
jgi:hypothetical protein